MKQLFTSIIIAMILIPLYYCIAQESESRNVQADPPPRDKDQWIAAMKPEEHQTAPSPKNGGQW